MLARALPASATVVLNVNAAGHPLPRLFSSGMVLQRDTAVPVWGRAAPGEQVTVSIADQSKQATTGPDGAWRVELDPMIAGGPYLMRISGSNTIGLSDVLVGDVWICAGQSNMVIHRAPKQEVEADPDLHVLGFSGRWYDRPSAVAYGFARELRDRVGVPIGIINRAAGGTTIRNWLPHQVHDDPDHDVQAVVGSWSNEGEQYYPQVSSFEGFAIKGVVYWQGEQDLKLARQDPGSVDNYRVLLPALVRAWRSAWQRPDLPFVFVQLPTGGGLQVDQAVAPLPPSPPVPDIAAKMRAAGFNGLEEPHTGLTISVDIDGGTHPKNRDQYATRIAEVALGTTYDAGPGYSGPIYSSMELEAGGRVRLHFRPGTADGLHAVGGPLQGFAISANGRDFAWADAAIDGSDVVVWNDAVTDPTVVRYAWDRWPTWANLFNDSDLGAAPFSTATTPAP